MNERISPHPVPLPLGEGVPLCPLRGRPLSQGERDRVRGVTLAIGATLPEFRHDVRLELSTILAAGGGDALDCDFGVHVAGGRAGGGGGAAAPAARHRRAYGEDQGHRVYAGWQATRLGLQRQDHPRVGSGERQDRAHDPGRERAGRCGQGLRHGAVAGRQMAGGGGVDGQVRGIRSLLRGYPPLRVRERQARGAVEGAQIGRQWPRILAGQQEIDFGERPRRPKRHHLGCRAKGGAAPARRA